MGMKDIKRILFVIPRIKEKLWSNYYPEIYLGLAYMAGLASEKGHQVKVIDLDSTNIKESRFLKEVKDYSPDIIAMTSLYGSIGDAKKIASLLRRNTKACIVLGGLPATFASEELLKTGLFDILVRGEGEMTFQDILSGKNLEEIDGISYFGGDSMIHNRDRAYVKDLDSLGIPLRDIFPLRRYKIRFQMHNSTAIETSRGCPYGCDFCTQKPKEGGKIRLRTVEMVRKELLSISRFPFIRRIMIVDNDFLVNRNHSEEILRMICTNGFNRRFHFMFATRVDNILRGGKGLIDLLVESNVNTIFFGLESLSDSKREKIGKIKNLKKTRLLFRTLESLGIDPLPSYMIGFPEETSEDMKKTLKSAMELNTRLFSLNILTPYPGTPFYQHCLDEGIILEHDLERYDNAHTIIGYDSDIQKEFHRMHMRYLLRWNYIFPENIGDFRRKPIYGRMIYLVYFILFVWLASALKRLR